MELSLYLKSKNISKKSFAFMIGVSPGAISNYCAATRTPSLSIALKIKEKTHGEVGLQDIRECLRAHRRRDGSYLVFLEEDAKSKVLMFRWKP